MSVTAEMLQNLHRLHRQLEDVAGRLRRGPMQVKAAEAKMVQLKDALAAAQEERKRVKMANDEKQLQLKSNEAKVAELKGKLNACSSNREYQALTEQIAAAEMANSVLEDEILEAMENIPAVEQKVADAEAALEKGKADAEAFRKKVADERDTLESELARLQEELNEAEKELPGDFRADYQRVVSSRGEDGMAPLDGEVCGGCYHKVTPQQFNLLKLHKPVFCHQCGRLLYEAEDTTA